MRKFIRLFLIILSAILLFVGCTDDYVIDETKTTVVFSSLYNDIKKIESAKEDENLIEEKVEFLKLFKECSGVSLPEYFIFPKESETQNWSSVYISTRDMHINTHFIVPKNDALKLLNSLIENDNWIGYRYFSSGASEKDKTKCSFFRNKEAVNHNHVNVISLNFHYNNDTDSYIVWLLASLERDPPPGTSWPERLFN